MKRTDADYHVGNLFQSGNPLTGQRGTRLDHTWLNAVQEEIVAPILAAGMVLDPGDSTQLLQSIHRLAGGYPTWALAQAATTAAVNPLPVGQIVMTSGHTTPGDGGGFIGIVEAEDSDINPGGGRIRPLAERGYIARAWFGLLDDETSTDRFFRFVMATPETVAHLGPGVTCMNTTVDITRRCGIVGAGSDGERTGTPRGVSTLKWTGGSVPMFTTNEARLEFVNFGVETAEGGTLATDFIELNAGAGSIHLEKLYFHTDIFSRSVIRSNGNRPGYSIIDGCVFPRPAIKIMDIDGQGTSNGCTPFTFTRCEFRNSSNGTGYPFTVVNVKDETLEGVRFYFCTINCGDGLRLLDTREAPLATTVKILSVQDCELDEIQAGGVYPLDLVNVDSIAVDNCNITGNGATDAFARLVDSTVTSFTGNEIKSLAHVFKTSGTSRVYGVGRNNAVWSTVDGIVDNTDATRTVLAQAATINIDGALFAPNEIEQIDIDIIDGSSFQIRIDNSKPQNMEPGQRFDVTVFNKSGVTRAFVNFHNSSFKADTTPSIADGKNRTWSFRYDGLFARQIGQAGPELDN